MKRTITIVELSLLIVLGCTENQVQQPPSIPSPPRELRALAAGDSIVSLNWIDQARFEDGFELFQSAGSDSPFVLADTIPPDTASWELTGCNPTLSYRYQLRSFNNIGHSAFTNIARVVDIKESFSIPNSPEFTTMTGIVVSPDGERLAVGYDYEVQTWDISTGTRLYSARSNRAGMPSFSPDGTLLAIAGVQYASNGFSILDAATGELLRQLEVDDSEAAQACAFHPDGGYFIGGTAYWDNGSYYARRRVWSTDDWTLGRTDDLVASSGRTLYYYSLTFSPDGAWLVASFSNDTVMVYSGVDFHGVRMHIINSPWDVAFSASGDQYCPAPGSGYLYSYNTEDGQHRDSLVVYASVISTAYSPDDQFLALLRHDLSSPETRWLELVRPTPMSTLHRESFNINYAGRNFIRFAGDNLIIALQESVTVYRFYR